MAYTKYSLTPANNNAAPPDGAPEGMLPSAVNDTMRDMMAQIRDVGDGIRGGTYTMTAPVITGGSITGVALSGNTLTSPVITGGSINNTTVGATTRSTGAFTTLASNGATTFTAGTASTSTTTGTAVITGGLGVSGRINAANFDGIVGANTAAAGNFTTLGATGVATFSAGTVSLPSITNIGDTNTGIYFPAADTIAFTEGGVESMRIDSSGNVGIGTSSPSSFSSKTLQVTGSSTDVAIKLTNTTTGSGNTSGFDFELNGNDINYVNRTASGTQKFWTNATERMRIDSSGNVLVGTTSVLGGSAAKLQVLGSTNSVIFQNTVSTAECVATWNSATSSDNIFNTFYTEASPTSRGSITYNRGAGLVAYNVTSDYRAKDIISNTVNSGEVIDSVPVYMGKMKGATQARPMFIAHETPDYAHTGEKDAVDKDGKPVYQQMDASSLVPVLWAEVQSLRKRLAILESK